MLRLALAALLLASAAAAQEGGDPNAGAVAPPPAEATGPLSLDDVKANIQTVVQSFVDKRTNDQGWFPLRDRATGMLRKLRVTKLDVEKTVDDGNGLYSVPAALSDQASGEKLRATFTVDFKGSEWAVTNLRLIKPQGQASKKAKSKPAR